MKQFIHIVLLSVLFSGALQAQRSGESRKRGGFSLSGLSSPTSMPADSLVSDSTRLNSKRITAFRLTDKIGDTYIAPMDTNRMNYYNSTLVEGKSVAIGYLGNLGSPLQSKIFSERKEERDFIFADAYDYYLTTPTNAIFFDTKIPYSNLMYTTMGGSTQKEEQLKGTLTSNFGKKVNVGADLDYIYGRGYYNSNGTKLLSYRLFGNYISDRYQMYAYLANSNFVNFENGGITNDRYITNPDDYTDGRRVTDTKNIPVRYSNTWNRVRGKQFFVSHRYNLGFMRTTEGTDEDGDPKEVFVPVSSIIHTLEYKDNRRRFITHDAAGVDSSYVNNYIEGSVNDTTSYWSIKNTFALSLREGFQDWAKFGLTAFINIDKSRYRLMDSIPRNKYIYDEVSTFVGGELSKRQGSILTYVARGELGIVGPDAGEFRLTGELKSSFPLFRKEASIKAVGYIKNLTPAFYQRHYHSKYFWWDYKLKNIQRVYAGAEVNLESTRTNLSAGVESIQNYVYFNTQGTPDQFESNLQVITARLKQDFRFGAFNWENEAVYQLSSEKKILPLPQLSLYSNMYLGVKLAKVLTLQLGADVHYHTSYYAPYYQPATQQFQLQEEVEVGNYPLINAYANLHLKQARFFVMFYNVGSKFVDPEYFSLPHYPLNPMSMKMGISVTFND